MKIFSALWYKIGRYVKRTKKASECKRIISGETRYCGEAWLMNGAHDRSSSESFHRAMVELLKEDILNVLASVKIQNVWKV